MDKARQLLITACSSLSRLQLRMLHKSSSAEYGVYNRVNRNPFWLVSDVQPPSMWLAETGPNSALSGAIRKVALINSHLLAMVDSPGEIDRMQACIVLQSLSSMAWSPAVIRLAKHLDVKLPRTTVE